VLSIICSTQSNDIIFTGERPPLSSITSCPEDVISLIDTCWNTNPQRRHTMELVAYIMERFVSEAGPIQPLDL